MKILFFSPFSGILPHVRFEVRLADGLRKIGHEVTVVNCDGLYRDFCITMSAHGLTETSDPFRKQAICRDCKRMRNANRSRFRYTSELVDEGFTPADAAEVDRLMAAVNASNFADFRNDGLPVGRIASYEFLINHKKNNLDLGEADFKAYRIALRNTLATQAVMTRAIRRIRPDRILLFDTGYSVNGMVRALADREAIPVYDFFPGLNISDQFSKINVARHNTISNFNHMKTAAWRRVRSAPIGREKARYVVDHFRSLFRATNIFVYSAPRDGGKADLRARFGAAPSQKLIVAALSSFDERFAGSVIGRIPDGHDSLFPSQASWCETLIGWFKDHPEYFLIIRTHPREFPNKREGVKSAHVEKLKEVFRDLPPNVAINWPTDNISIYNMAEEVDVFLSAWSNVGLEMSLFGLPVVIYSDELILYPSDLNFLGKTREEYFERIVEAAGHGWDFEKARMAFRWYALQFRLASVDMEERPLPAGALLQKGFRFLGRKTGVGALLDVAERLYIDQGHIGDNAIRQIEEVLLGTLPSLSDAAGKPAEAPVGLEEETDGMLAELETLFAGFPGRILNNLRAYAAKRTA